MKTLFILALVALVLCAAAFSLSQSARVFRKTGIMAYNALTDGITPNRTLSRLADAVQSTRHLLYKTGSDAAHVAIISAASDKPLGWSQDSPEAAEESLDVQMPGGPNTVLGIAGATLSAGVRLYSKGDGKVMGTPTTAGTYWYVGDSVTTGTDGSRIEINPAGHFQKVVVVANGSTLSQISAVMLDGAVVVVLAA